jgi:hypothetical protein
MKYTNKKFLDITCRLFHHKNHIDMWLLQNFVLFLYLWDLPKQVTYFVKMSRMCSILEEAALRHTFIVLLVQ